MFKTPQQQVAFIAVSSLLAAFSLISIVNFVDPFTASRATLFFFYASLFLTVCGGLTICGLFFRRWLKQGVYIINLGDSFRQAILVSVLVVASFLLLANRLFYWWLEGSLILLAVFIEIFLNLKI